MKLVTVIYEAGIDDSMSALLGRLELPGWTRVEGATGSGRKGLRLDSAIWPGSNNVLFVALADERVAAFLRALEELKAEYLIPPALKAFVVPVEAEA